MPLSLVLLGALVTGPASPRIGATGDSGDVVIKRDEYGVPHIFASSVEAGYYGLGYAQAEDVLEGILTLILRARGELAAYRGATFLSADVEQRRWRHVEAAEAGFHRLSPTLQAAYRQYVAGIQAFIAKNPSAVPAWAPKLTISDAMALSRSLLWTSYQAGIGRGDCRRGGVKLAEAERAPRGAQPSVASDEWVLAPWRTAAGATIVLSDPHGEINGSLFYEYRIHAGPLESAGFALGPMLLLAHNRSLAWGETTGNPDVADCYEVEVDPTNPLRYRYDGTWRSMETRREIFVVKDSRPVTRTMEYTRHNGVLSPVVARVGNKAYVVSTAYMDSLATPAFDEEVYRLNLAKTVFEAKDAMRTLGVFPQNFMFGDAGGNIWYLRAGRTPIRPEGFDWTRPVPGNTSATAWRGIHPLDDLVQVLNPPQGYLSNNNISPDMMLPEPPVAAERYPKYVFNDTPGRTNTRALRAIEALSRAYAFTTEDAVQLALDEKWYGVERWQRLLSGVLAGDPASAGARPAEFRRFADAILRFDGHARATSTAALQFLYWQEAMGSTIDASLLTELGRALAGTGHPSPAVGRGVADAIDTALATLRLRHGPGEATLGDEFRVGPASQTWPIGGVSILPKNRGQCAVALQWDWACLVTLRAMTAGPVDSTGRRRVYLGSRALRLISFEKPIRSYSLHLFGQSGDPKSPHYTDQIPLASERRLKPEYFEPRELEGHVASTTTLTIGPAASRKR
ncbi:MAG: penicillin acylase family protein [Gemmatimonadota bacterium]